MEEIMLIAKDENLQVNIDEYNKLEQLAKEKSKKAHVKHKQQLNETAIAEGKKLNLDDFKVHFIQNQCSVLNASPKGKKSK